MVALDGALPGDVVTWTEGRRRGRFVEGDLCEIVTESPHRIAPTCPHASTCGGCDLGAFEPNARSAALSEVVRRAVAWDAEVPWVPSPHAVGYRGRVTLHVDAGRLGYRAAGSHALAPIDGCEIANPAIQGRLPDLAALVARAPDAPPRRVEVRTDGHRVVLVWDDAVTAAPPRDDAAFPDVAHGARVLAGDPTLSLEVDGVPLKAPPTAFFQVNAGINALLAAWVRDRVLAVDPERVLDLYAGIGNLGLPLARRGVPVVAVERDGPALEALRDVATAHGWNVEAIARPAENFDPAFTPYDVAVLDPPRAGAGQVLARVLRNRPKRVVYVACDIVAAARDVRQHAKGYRLTDVCAFDMFPKTHHVEVGLVLDRA